MREALDPDKQIWMKAAPLARVMAVLKKDGGAARFVGGAVRNALLGAPVLEVDIATDLTPDIVVKRLKDAGIQAVPTGIEHGTVTAVSSGTPFEITTLRRDVSTDGRRATVAFTDDWAQDAMRRDFTMNALYADEDGTLHDFVNGLADLRAGHVRFVGEARERIAEDYLRILRLFRFHAWYGKGELDAEALKAAAAEREGLERLSGERVQKELLRLLAAVDPFPSLRAMERNGILDVLIPSHAGLAALTQLNAITRAQGLAPDPILRLASLLATPDAAARLAAVLKFSNADRARLTGAHKPIVRPEGDAQARGLIYQRGAAEFQDALLLSSARAGLSPDNKDMRRFLALARDWQKPKFPLDGNDAQSAGIAPGPRLGDALSRLEQEWVASDFAQTRAHLLARLKELAGLA
jgi:poly(A) polymerase